MDYKVNEYAIEESYCNFNADIFLFVIYTILNTSLLIVYWSFYDLWHKKRYISLHTNSIHLYWKTGLGIEVVKNLVLAGPGALTLHDDSPCEIRDLGSNFFLTEGDVGKARSKAVIDKVKELNDTVRVSIHEGVLTEDVVKNHDCVVFINQSRKNVVQWDNFCRNRSIDGVDERGLHVSVPSPIIFISSELHGPAGSIFCDFGNEFLVRDGNGEPPISRTIKKIYYDKEKNETVIDLINPMDSDLSRRHNLEENSHDGYLTASNILLYYAMLWRDWCNYIYIFIIDT